MSEKIIELNNNNFNTIVSEKSDFIVIDFWAPWCGPCRMMSPVFEEIANELKDNTSVKFAKVNVDENPDLGTKFRVTSIPFFIIFKNGKAVATKVGGSTKASMQEWIVSNLK